VAVGHSILVICYHVLEREVPYEELVEDYLDQRRSGPFSRGPFTEGP
jgi:hypothetical protein